MACGFIIAFVLFVASLEQGMYKVQFSQLAWTFVILQITILQSSFYLNSLFEGLLWFFLPVALVVANDIWAFICGFFFGKTPLIQLSPKKTWEGTCVLPLYMCTYITCSIYVYDAFTLCININTEKY